MEGVEGGGRAPSQSGELNYCKQVMQLPRYVSSSGMALVLSILLIRRRPVRTGKEAPEGC